MRRFLIALIFPLVVYGAPPANVYQSHTRDASSTNVPNTFTDSDAEFISALTNRPSNICIVNDTATNIFVCVAHASASNCTEDGSIYVANGAGECRDNIVLAKSIFVKGASAISSGRVHVGVW